MKKPLIILSPILIIVLLLSACSSRSPDQMSESGPPGGGIKSGMRVDVCGYFYIVSGKREDGIQVIGVGGSMKKGMDNARPLPPLPSATASKPTSGGAKPSGGLFGDSGTVLIEAIGDHAYGPGGRGDAEFIGLIRIAITRGQLKRELFSIPGIKFGRVGHTEFPGSVFLPTK